MESNRHFLDGSGRNPDDHKEVCFRQSMAHLKNQAGHEGVIASEYQKVVLLEDVEEEIVGAEISKVKNPCIEISNLVEAPMPYHLLLIVDLKAKKKTVNKFKGVCYRTPTRHSLYNTRGNHPNAAAAAPANTQPTPLKSGQSGNKRQHINPYASMLSGNGFLGLFNGSTGN